MHFSIIDKVSNILSIPFLQNVSGHRILPLFYHAVGNEQDMPYARKLYTIPSEKEFETHIDFLLKHYKPLDLKQLIAFKNNGKLPTNNKFFFLSFDDGLRQCSEIIAPILKRKGVPATFFINTAFVDNNDFIHRFKTSVLREHVKNDQSDKLKSTVEQFFGLQFSCRYKAANHIMTLKFREQDKIEELANLLEIDVNEELKGYRPYMSKAEISKLANAGFTIGAHGVQHPEFMGLSEDEQVAQASDSINQIVEWFNVPYKVFSFPFTDVGVKASFFKKLKEQTHVDLTFGCSGLKIDEIETNIHRIPIDNRKVNIESRLKSEMLHFALKRLVGKHKFRRLGD